MSDRLLNLGARLAAAASGGLLALIVLFVALEAVPALRIIGFARFFTDDAWHPLEDAFRVTPMLAATVVAALGATLLATPLGVGVAVLARFHAPRRVGWFIRRVVELLAGIPSVVYGLWGLTTLAPLIGAVAPPGPSLLTAVLVLALMILPTVALTADSALASVPADQLRAAAALGLSRGGRVISVALPLARRGIMVGVVLALARAIGETMAVLMVAGNVVRWPVDPTAPVRTITANIALEMSYADATHRSVLFVTALLLMILVGLLVVTADRLGDRRRERLGGRRHA